MPFDGRMLSQAPSQHSGNTQSVAATCASFLLLTTARAAVVLTFIICPAAAQVTFLTRPSRIWGNTQVVSVGCTDRRIGLESKDRTVDAPETA